MPIKIAVRGNLANVGNNLARYLAEAGANVELVLYEHQSEHWKFANHGLDPKCCPWIRFIPGNRWWNLFSEQRTMRSYDAVISVTLGGMWYLPFQNKPYVCYATGADMREVAAGNGYPWLMTQLARKHFRNASLVFYSPDFSQVEVVRKLGLAHIIPWRQFVDTDFWKPAKSEFSAVPLRIFHPSNLQWCEKFPGQSSKGNDVAFRGFHSFLQEGGRGELSYLNRGQNVLETQTLVTELGLKTSTKVLGESLNRNQLKKAITGADVILDQFGLGTFGLLALEAMAAGKPTITYAAPEMMKLAYPGAEEKPPVLNAKTPGEVAAHLHALENPEFRRTVSEASRNWIEKYHSPQKLAAWYLAAIQLHVQAKLDSLQKRSAIARQSFRT